MNLMQTRTHEEVEAIVAELRAIDDPNDPRLQEKQDPAVIQRLHAIRERMREQQKRKLATMGYETIDELRSDMNQLVDRETQA